MKIGDVVQHHDFPGFRMTMLDTAPCNEEGCTEQTIKIIDPEGQEDWAHASDFTKLSA